MRSLMWFRQDLRIKDNPALIEACKFEVIPIYIEDVTQGSMSRLWTERALEQFDLKIYKYTGNAVEIIEQLVKENEITNVFWNKCYENHWVETDFLVEALLRKLNVNYASYNASLLWEPNKILKNDGTYYKVFTPFYRKGCMSSQEPRLPLDMPGEIRIGTNYLQENWIKLPHQNWHTKFEWDMTESGGHVMMEKFMRNGLINYKEGRNFPSQNNVSMLSPYLHFGHVSPNQVWHAAKSSEGIPEVDLDHFLSELGWREFSYYLLHHFPELSHKNFQPKFDKFGWRFDKDLFNAWKKGKTGYPIVDAGMRQLWQTGYIHNRVRMIVASFLVKNLLIHWHYGRDWFWGCLADADLASNSASWQWVAGSGADAAPYFRIFNPILQSKKFDSHGTYIRRYVPEIASLPDQYIHEPWEVPSHILAESNIILGVDYPHRIVDLDKSREQSLEEYKNL